MPWKVDEKGNMVMQDGNPVWVYEDGKEAGFNAENALKNIGALKEEAKSHRLKYKEAADQLKAIADAGVEDIGEFITTAKKALETVKNLKDGDLVKAGEVETLKTKITTESESKLKKTIETYDKKLAEKDAEIAKRDKALNKVLIEKEFIASEFINKKTTLPPEIAYEYFGKRFVVEDINGEMVPFALDAKGEKLLSIKNAGDYAKPDEAIELIIMEWPQKDKILIRDASGGGTHTKIGGPTGDKVANPWKKETRNLTQQMKIAKENPALADRLRAEAGIKQG